jgi:site-specific recombinase XerD
LPTNNQQPELPFTEPVRRSSALSFERAATLFLQHCRDRRLAENTVRAYGSDFADFGLFAGEIRAAVEIDAATLQAYVRRMLEGQRRTPSTVRRRLASIRAMFRWLDKGKLVSPSPFSGLDLSIRLPRRLPRALGTEETTRLLARARLEARSRRTEGHDSLMAQFVVVALVTTGLRVGELTTVRVSDVSRREGYIQVRGKGDRERRVYMPGHQALAILASYLASRSGVRTLHDRVLALADGRPATSHRLRRMLGALAIRAGVGRRVTPHMLRHTAATQLLEAGVDIRFVQRLLGHRSIATTQIYTHVSDRALKMRLTRANVLARLA